MDEIVRKDALQILNRVISILEIKEEKDMIELTELSNRIIHDASVFQDEISISIAVLIYALSKIIERKQDNLDYKEILNYLEKARKHLYDYEEKKGGIAIKKLFSKIHQKLMIIESIFKNELV